MLRYILQSMLGRRQTVELDPEEEQVAIVRMSKKLREYRTLVQDCRPHIPLRSELWFRIDRALRR